MSTVPLFELADKSGQWKVKKGTSYVPTIAPKTISRTRQDIKNWNDALNMANNVDQPKRFPLYNLYDNILIDLHLQSQINNRMLKSLAQPFIMKDLNGKLNQDLTDLLQNKKWVYQINKALLQTIFYGHSLGEFDYVNGELVFNLIPRQNVDPVSGCIYTDYTEDKKLMYRQQKEYGSWLIEFGDNKDFGLLNGCVPHVLMKRFAQSCYSELCEIYGIPPRVLKTNTQDRTMVSRGEKMLKDMGSAAWFIIDENESFQFAQGVSTNGDVYKGLLSVCNNEMSMGISGTVVGQDTKNGSNSKEKTSIGILQDLVDSDLSLIEQAWNATVIPALKALGIITTDAVYAYPPAEDLDKLWKMTVEASGFNEIDSVWVKDTFGIQTVGAKKQSTPTPGTKLSLEDYERFFV
jgi:phage gp29-like protein